MQHTGTYVLVRCTLTGARSVELYVLRARRVLSKLQQCSAMNIKSYSRDTIHPYYRLRNVWRYT